MWVDVHSHLLPEVDDGPHDWEESLALAAFAAERGTEVLVCTPHDLPDVYDNPPERILPLLEEFQARLDADGLPLRVLPGNEVYLVAESIGRLDRGELNFLGGASRSLLVELPVGSWPMGPEGVESLLFELSVRDVTPVLAHVERYEALRRDPHLLGRLVERGCVGQTNASAVAGREGKTTQRLVLEWLRKGWVRLLGSDGHSAQRPPSMRSAREVLRGQRNGTALLARIDADSERLLHGERPTT